MAQLNASTDPLAAYQRLSSFVFFVALLVRRFLLWLPLPLAYRGALLHRWWRLCGCPDPHPLDGWL